MVQELENIHLRIIHSILNLNWSSGIREDFFTSFTLTRPGELKVPWMDLWVDVFIIATNERRDWGWKLPCNGPPTTTPIKLLISIWAALHVVISRARDLSWGCVPQCKNYILWGWRNFKCKSLSLSLYL